MAMHINEDWINSSFLSWIRPRQWEWHATINSTQERAIELAKRGAPHGTFVGADEQTSGRGRDGRVWQSPSEHGLYVSWIVRPDACSQWMPWMQMIAAAALCGAIRTLAKESTRLSLILKWPNDLFVGNRKIGGILVDSLLNHHEVEYAIIGVGISIHHQASDFPMEMRDKTTSWVRLGVEPPQREVLLAACHEELMKVMNRFYASANVDVEAMRHYIKQSMPRMPINLPFRTREGIVMATPLDLDTSMRLLIEKENGSRFWIEPNGSLIAWE